MNDTEERLKEFNRLKIENLDQYLSVYVNRTIHFVSAFQILANLEAEIRFLNTPESEISITYKTGAKLSFYFVGMDESVRPRIAKYRFDNLHFAACFS
jgi:hypothetical protein